MQFSLIEKKQCKFLESLWSPIVQVSWQRNGGPRSAWVNVANVTAQSYCVTVPMQDGDTYDVSVRAFDIMNNTNTDDVTVHVDHTPPVASEQGLRGRWGETGV